MARLLTLWPVPRASLLALLLASAVPAARPAEAVPLSNAGPVIEQMSKLLADQSIPLPDRVEIVKALETFGSEETRGPLVAALKDPAPEIRERAAYALSRPGDLASVQPLREVAEASGEVPAVRAAAVWALGVIGDESVRPLVVAAASDPEPAVRRAALRSLTLGGLARPADRTAYLLQLAKDHGIDLQIRTEAVQTLGEVKEPQVVETLTALLETEPAIPMPLPPPRATQQDVMMVRYRQARDVRAWAVSSLGKLDARTALPQIKQAAQAPEDFFLRQMSLMVLLGWNAPDLGPVLVGRLDDPFDENRWLALVGIGKSRDRSLVDPVLAKLEDKSSAVRAQAITTLGELGDPRVRARLEELRDKDNNPDVQQAIEKALPQLGS